MQRRNFTRTTLCLGVLQLFVTIANASLPSLSRRTTDTSEFAAPLAKRSAIQGSKFQLDKRWTTALLTPKVYTTLNARQSCAVGNAPCGAGCCSASDVCCTVGCCDAGEKCATLINGQPGCCPQSAIQCSSGGCCAAGQECCTGNGCCPGGQNCCSGGCAQDTSTCCNNHQCVNGRSCCGNGGCYDPATEICCSNGGACSKNETCCGDVCCRAGASCSGGTCVAPTPAQAQPSVTAPTATPKATIVFKYYPQKMVKNGKGKRIPLSNKAILMNMCDGIKKYLGQASQEIQLTKDKASQGMNRAIMCPQGFCADAIEEYAKMYPGVDPSDLVVASGMSCDEFPFASSKQGGDLVRGTRICVEGWENSWQGGTMSRKMSKLIDGDDFLVRIEGWDCDKQAPAVKRELTWEKREDDFDYDNLTGDDLFTGFDDSDNALILALGDLNAGTFTYSLHLTSGTISSAFVADYLGNQYYVSPSSIQSSSSVVNISFVLSGPAYGVGLVAIQDPSNGNISLGYTASKSSPSIVPAPTDTANGASLGRDFSNLLLFIPISLILVTSVLS